MSFVPEQRSTTLISINALRYFYVDILIYGWIDWKCLKVDNQYIINCLIIYKEIK